MSALLQVPTVATSIADLGHFTAWVSAEGDHHTVHPCGELDLSTRRVLVDACIQSNQSLVLVDLEALTFMDCSGYSALVEAGATLEHRSGSLTFANAVGQPAFLLKLLETLGTRRCQSTET